jgi:hypothetical protein
MKKVVLMVAGAAVQKLMMQLKDEQEILMAVADMTIDLFMAESALLRVMKLDALGKKSDDGVQDAMLQVLFTDAMDRVNKSGKTAIMSFATGDEQRMMLLGLKRFTKYAPVNTTAARRTIAAQLIAGNKYAL